MGQSGALDVEGSRVYGQSEPSGSVYAGKPVGEVIFWDTDDEGYQFERSEMSAFRVWLDRVVSGRHEDNSSEKLLTQDL
jgi:hypothetical protein